MVNILVIFFLDRPMFSQSFKRSGRELFIDVTEHRFMLKHYQKSHYHRLSFIPKTGIAFPKTGFLFLFYCTVYVFLKVHVGEKLALLTGTLKVFTRGTSRPTSIPLLVWPQTGIFYGLLIVAINLVKVNN